VDDRKPVIHTPAISFIVPVRNDADRLRRCLQSLTAGTPPPGGVEIIVADNGSTDDSADVARAHGATVLVLPDVRLGLLRNRAAAAAHAPVLAFVDADHEIGREWVPVALALLERDDVAGVGAPYHAPTPGTWVQQFYDRLRRRTSGQTDVDWLGSGNLALRRTAFDAVGGFDAALETCEDVDLCRKLLATGGRLIADERLHSVHYGDPRTLRHVFLGELWRGRDNVRVSLRAPRSWRTMASAAIPLLNLASLSAGVVGLLSARLAGLVMASVGFGWVLGMILLRASRIAKGESRDLPQAFAVAAAYEMGRALALATRVGYGRRRPAAVTP
jgi:GT2 family glycosyltransferase